MPRSRPFLRAVLPVLLVALVGGCKKPASPSTDGDTRPSAATSGDAAQTGVESEQESSAMLTVTSPAFGQNARIPVRYTGDGEDISPELHWSDPPAGTAEFALVVDDPDAPTSQPWVHWVIYKIPVASTSLPENVAKTDTPAGLVGVLQGSNSFNRVGYGGPAPPRGHGTHHYHFKLYALDSELSVAAGLTKTQLLDAIEGHVLSQAELVGTYDR